MSTRKIDIKISGKTICQILLIVCSTILALYGQDGWGWLLALLVLTTLGDDEPSCDHDDETDDQSDDAWWREFMAERLSDWHRSEDA